MQCLYHYHSCQPPDPLTADRKADVGGSEVGFVIGSGVCKILRRRILVAADLKFYPRALSP